MFLLGVYPFSYSLIGQFPKKAEHLPERKASPRISKKINANNKQI